MHQVYTIVFHDPSRLLKALEFELAKRPKQANIIYAHAYKLSREEHRASPNQFWIACYTAGATLDFVLSCTEGVLGSYPIFIYSNHPASYCNSPTFLEPRMAALANRLYDCVPADRIFSVFSLTAITHSFASKWTQLTGIQVVKGDPWYSATSSFCTIQTFRGPSTPFDPDHVIRPATLSDLDQCARLCEEFAATSPPFVLNRDQAKKEAEHLIRNRQLWVYELPSGTSGNNNHRAISTILAVTRTTPTVSAITKVFTTAAYRKRGCADRLVAHVTRSLLEANVDHSVVLYVGHTLDAVRVYDRVGFVGLSPNTRDNVDSVEDWLELGFEGAQLGHW